MMHHNTHHHTCFPRPYAGEKFLSFNDIHDLDDALKKRGGRCSNVNQPFYYTPERVQLLWGTQAGSKGGRCTSAFVLVGSPFAASVFCTWNHACRGRALSYFDRRPIFTCSLRPLHMQPAPPPPPPQIGEEIPTNRGNKSGD